jgi:hypothetical protein
MDPERPAAKHKAKKRAKKQKKEDAPVKYAYEDETKVLQTLHGVWTTLVESGSASTPVPTLILRVFVCTFPGFRA